MSEIATSLDEVSLCLLAADELNGDTLSDLEQRLRALAELLEAAQHAEPSVAANRLAHWMRSEASTPSKAISDVAAQTLSGIQAALRQDGAGICWPQELGIQAANKSEAEKQRTPNKRRGGKRASKKRTSTSASEGADIAVDSARVTDSGDSGAPMSIPASEAPAIREAAPRESHPAAEAPAEPAAKPTAVAESLVDAELVEDFVREAQEHLETADVQLLALETEPRNAESLSAVFRAFHTIKGVAGFMGLETISAVAHEAENVLDRARCGELLLVGPAVDGVFAAVDLLKRLIAHLQSRGATASADLQRAAATLITTLQSVLNQQDDASSHSTDTSALSSATPPPEGNVAGASVDAPRSTQAGEADPAGGVGAGAGGHQAETLRVDRRRLDSLVDMIGELVIAEAMVQQDLGAAAVEEARVGRNLAQLNKITRNLQELSLSLRMVPVRATFQKMARMVRDLSKRLNKPVDFRMVGEDTELDKTVVDEIGDPLMHMVRNAVDHGIETNTADRVARGKPARGTVTLKSFHQGGNIFIEIHDDGRGLDPERLRAKARERGLIAQDAHLSDRDALQLIFHPGFSTAEQITDVSGRGVGMDVVRRNIEALRGSVDLRSAPGHGTCVSMRLPLTLAIIDGMAVQVDQQRYILPTLSIVELLRPREGEIRTVQGKGEYFTLREEHLPLLRASHLFGARSTATGRDQDTNAAPRQGLDSGIVVVVEDERTKAGLLVDAVLGQQQAVIKSLGHGLEEQPGLAGGAVMPDGRVGLILDVHGLLALAAGKATSAPTR